MDTTPQVRPWLLVVTTLTVAGGLYLVYESVTRPVASTHIPLHTEVTLPEVSPSVETTAADGTVSTTAQVPTRVTALSGYLKKEFGDQIEHPYIQLRMLGRLVEMLKEQYGDDWEPRLRELLAQAFPDLVDVLMKRYEDSKVFSEWHTATAQAPYRDATERRRAEWNKRLEVFGEDAKKIWEDDYRQYRMETSLADIDGSGEALDARVDAYVSTIKDVYGADFANTMDPVSRQSGFLELGSTQRDLAAMSAADRAAALKDIREAVGLDPQAIDRLAELDAQRDAERARGEAYMQARETLLMQYQGEDLQGQIDALRSKTFSSEEAGIIQGEEDAGYFRFGQPRIIGGN
jgi:hypothetical protein